MEFSASNMKAAADDMAQMSADDLRASADSMRADPDAIRRQVPAMAGLTDAQICAAADNLTAMADNAALRQQTIAKCNAFGDGDVDQIRDALPPVPFAQGDTVEVKGLVGFPQHNGKKGAVTEVKQDRVCVMLQGADAPMSLKPANLELARSLSLSIRVSFFVSRAIRTTQSESASL